MHKRDGSITCQWAASHLIEHPSCDNWASKLVEWTGSSAKTDLLASGVQADVMPASRRPGNYRRIEPRPDVSPENSGRVKPVQGGGLALPFHKEQNQEAGEILGAADHLPSPPRRERCLHQRPVSPAWHRGTNLPCWKTKYAHLGVSRLRRLWRSEGENSRLKRLVADLSRG